MKSRGIRVERKTFWFKHGEKETSAIANSFFYMI